ncbi:MAG: hypothetical protein IKF01_00830 [Bacilli bacterium]|nr:hypothetical protein [Bacilli bacterium]
MDNRMIEAKYYSANRAYDEIFYYSDMLKKVDGFEEKDGYSTDLKEIKEDLKRDMKVLYDYNHELLDAYVNQKPFFYYLHDEDEYANPEDDNYDECYFDLSDQLYEAINESRDLLDNYFKDDVKKDNLEDEVSNIVNSIHDNSLEVSDDDVDNVMSEVNNSSEELDSKIEEIRELYSNIGKILDNSSLSEIDKSIKYINDVCEKINSFKDELDNNYSKLKALITVSNGDDISNLSVNVIYSNDSSYSLEYETQKRNYDYVLNYYKEYREKLENKRKYLLEKENNEVSKDDSSKDNALTKHDLTVQNVINACLSKESLTKLFEENGVSNVWIFIRESLDKNELKMTDFVNLSNSFDKYFDADEIVNLGLYDDEYKKTISKYPLPEPDVKRVFRTAKYGIKGPLEGIVKLFGGYENFWYSVKNDLEDGAISKESVASFVEDLKVIYSEEELKNILKGGYNDIFNEVKTEIINEDPKKDDGVQFDVLQEDPMKDKKDAKKKKGFFEKLKDSITNTFGGEKPNGRVIKRIKLKSDQIKKIKDSISKKDIFTVALTSLGMITAGGLVHAANVSSMSSNLNNDENVSKMLDDLKDDKVKPEISINNDESIDVSNKNDEEIKPEITDKIDGVNSKKVYISSSDAVNGENAIEPSDDFVYYKVAAFDTETGEWILLTEDQLNDENYMRKENEKHGGRLAMLLGDDYGNVKDNIENADGWVPAPKDEGGRSR